MKRTSYILLFIVSLSIFISCNREPDNLILTVEDIRDQRIAVESGTLNDEDLSALFPEAKCKEFKSTSDILLTLSIGKFDAAVVSTSIADKVMAETLDFETIDEELLSGDGVRIIVHKSRTPGRDSNKVRHGNFIENSVSRIRDSIISEYYGRLILWGLLITLTIFICSWILAMTIAVIMTLLSLIPRMRLIWKATMTFIRYIHDVPSVVLIFFFYYVVFAHVNTNGLLACIVALGVYGSGSFSNIICAHLDRMDPLQFKAARMLGLKGWKMYRLVILPQAVKSMLPFILSESKVLLRATTYAGYISILDIVKVSELIRNQTYDTLVPLFFVSIIFLILSHFIREGLYMSYNKLFTDR